APPPAYSASPRSLPSPPPSTLPPYTTLFRSLDRLGVGLPRPRVPAECVRPDTGPGALGQRAAGHEHAARVVEHVAGEGAVQRRRSEEHTSELQSRFDLVCRLLLEKKKQRTNEEFACTLGMSGVKTEVHTDAGENESQK